MSKKPIGRLVEGDIVELDFEDLGPFIIIKIENPHPATNRSVKLMTIRHLDTAIVHTAYAWQLRLIKPGEFKTTLKAILAE